jgi:hypothetical protein
MTFRLRRPAVLWLALFLLTAPPARAQDETCSSKVPANIDAGPLAPAILDALARSETFRRQCLRIADTRVLRVRLDVVSRPQGDYRALTVLERYEAGSLRAEVTLVFAQRYVELLAHEFEHVLEQVDGVNLRADAAHGRARVLPDGAYETRRATEVGLQVLREYEALPPEAGRRRQMRLR